ncbi:DUF6979 family protein [Aeromonas hydrophila]|uniref:DUF6979 family protein n=1 Tax=Aeromonas hydrophila TaxID=644 RepID=UPI002B053798|nr:hypothetical protein [Aeromonas hydrophila]
MIFGDIAVRAVKNNTPTEGNAREAWNVAATGKNKGCPRTIFLGLCHVGLVKGIDEIGNYPESIKGRERAVEAVRLLDANPEYAENPNTLWKAVKTSLGLKPEMGPNGRMDVVCGLWKAGLLKPEALAEAVEQCKA